MEGLMNFFRDFTLGQDYINAFVLIGLITINIFLGSLDAWINKNFDKTKFIKGLKRGIGISVAMLATYQLGQLSPNAIVMTSNSVDVNIPTAIGLIISGSIIWYGKDIIVKFKKYLSGNKDLTK